MLRRTQTAMNLLDVMQQLEILDVSFLNDDGWIKCDDRKTLYEAAIFALIENAQSEGFVVTDLNGEPITEISVDDAPCNMLDAGCTCEDCTKQITDALGM